MPDQILKVEPVESKRPIFLIHFASHRAAAIAKRNHLNESLPAFWGKQVLLMWQPNKEVEDRIKAKKARDSLKNLALLNVSKHQNKVSSNDMASSSNLFGSAIASAPKAEYQQVPSLPTVGNGYFPAGSSYATENLGHRTHLTTRPTDFFMDLNFPMEEGQPILSKSAAGIRPSFPESAHLTESLNHRAILEDRKFNPVKNVQSPMETSAAGISPSFPESSHLAENSNRRAILKARPFNPVLNVQFPMADQLSASTSSAQNEYSLPISSFPTENLYHDDPMGAFSSGWPHDGINASQSNKGKENLTDMLLEDDEGVYGSSEYAMIQAEAELSYNFCKNSNGGRHPVLESANMAKNQTRLRF